MSQNGKGSKPRPLSVSYKTYTENYDNIFRKKKPEETKSKKNEKQN
jgi:hypothetical protein